MGCYARRPQSSPRVSNTTWVLIIGGTVAATKFAIAKAKPSVFAIVLIAYIDPCPFLKPMANKNPKGIRFSVDGTVKKKIPFWSANMN